MKVVSLRNLFNFDRLVGKLTITSILAKPIKKIGGTERSSENFTLT
jgi:hypothetical protein